uniref:hypothetical protein n=1 Tax=Hassallia byssoidea TaxID=482630 RepID=UPI0007C701AB|nr:hypothetical protein [Hassalia byssoidea]
MELNNFSLSISPGTELSGGYVQLEHNTQYNVVLANKRAMRCDAKLEIDGKHVGTWRLEEYDSIVLERPAHDTGRFTFYKLGSAEASIAGISKEDANIGLVKVTFTPEHQVQTRTRTGYSSPPVTRGTIEEGTTRSFSAGGTGLSGESKQQFGNATAIDYDYSQATVIHLRLVARADEPRPLTPLSNPVPPPIHL